MVRLLQQKEHVRFLGFGRHLGVLVALEVVRRVALLQRGRWLYAT